MKSRQKLTIGRTDKIDFPEWGLYNIDAKIDSGAYTSSIHCDNITAFYKNGAHTVRFTVYDADKPNTQECKVFASKQVKNSFGQIAYRYTIKTTICLFDKNYVIELALTDRSTMKNPVLLGRKVLRDRFIIDVTRQNLSYHEKMKTMRSEKKKEIKYGIL
ncbi:MAG: ATP-dependent zinc protease [Chitinophagaceae bacterium]|nr:ATP-dependent zinc protease [Chitinophagaceae bacterium]